VHDVLPVAPRIRLALAALEQPVTFKDSSKQAAGLLDETARLRTPIGERGEITDESTHEHAGHAFQFRGNTTLRLRPLRTRETVELDP
jgi:hypothetical protein